jgi:glycogen(starch) synthase
MTGEKMPSQFTNLQCCSQFVLSKIENAGAAAGDCEVIHWGVELANIADSTQNPKESSRLLYVGQVERHKGVHTAIKAFSILRREVPDVTLTIVGGSSSQSYATELRQLANETGASSAITFVGRVSSADLGEVLAKHDILLFTSEWDEPFAITPLEAMLSRLAVVATTTGGSREIFENNINALTFEAGSPEDCARQTLKLLKNPDLTERLAHAGHDVVRNKFSLGAMIDKIDNHIRRVVLQAQENS